MPSALKKWMLNELMEQFRECEHLLFVGYQGISALDVFELRNKLREVGAEMQVVKNSIAALMLKEIGRENVKDFLDGPVAVITGGDAAAAVESSFPGVRSFRQKIGFSVPSFPIVIRDQLRSAQPLFLFRLGIHEHKRLDKRTAGHGEVTAPVTISMTVNFP